MLVIFRHDEKLDFNHKRVGVPANDVEILQRWDCREGSVMHWIRSGVDTQVLKGDLRRPLAYNLQEIKDRLEQPEA